jgi:hypothetical protein
MSDGRSNKRTDRRQLGEIEEAGWIRPGPRRIAVDTVLDDDSRPTSSDVRSRRRRSGPALRIGRSRVLRVVI